MTFHPAVVISVSLLGFGIHTDVNDFLIPPVTLTPSLSLTFAHFSFDPSAETNCEALIAKAISLSPHNPEVQVTLASIRMSQQKFEEAKAVILEMYNDMEGKEPCEYNQLVEYIAFGDHSSQGITSTSTTAL